MTPAFAASAAIFLLLATASAQAQSSAAGDSGVASAQASPVPGKPDGRPVDTPKLRDQLLQGAINLLLKPRPRPQPPQAAPAPVAAAPAAVIEPPFAAAPASTVEPSPSVPQLATEGAVTPVVRPVAAPRPAAPGKPAPTPRLAQNAAPPPGIEPVVTLPSATEFVTSAPPVELSTPPPPSPAVVELGEPASAVAPERIGLLFNINLWLFLGLIVGAAAAASQWRRARQIARTRAALRLSPSLDLAFGVSSGSDLAMTGPSLAIRATLDMSEPLRG